ncbi:MAG: DNA-formamidopyrimidine glycosylase family protein, partial [Pirellula sp.]
MPELPDVLLYVSAMERYIAGSVLQQLIIRSPFVLRTFEVDASELHGKRVETVSRLGKRLVIGFDEDLFVVVHLMIAGRFHWKKTGTMPKGKVDLAAFQFASGTMMLTEASNKKRAGLWIVRGRVAVDALHTPGINPLEASFEEFRLVLCLSNNTLKRALTDPKRFDGIGNAYSDEILHRARLSPLQWTSRLTNEETQSLWGASRETLREWIDRLQTQNGMAFPERVTAFRPDMAVHGRYGEPCPVCQRPVQRIRYADNE